MHLLPQLAIIACVVTTACLAKETANEAPCNPTIPLVTQEAPAPGKRVEHQLPDFKNTKIHHLLYLPTDYTKDKTYPVIIEYPGNGPFRNQLGDTCSGAIDTCKIGYGLTGGKGAIWVSMPFLSKEHTHHQRQWWGDPDATASYCRATVKMVCENFGGDPKKLFIAGFSRGAIACNYIGLRDEKIASLWRGFICHSHYDGVRNWGYGDSDRASAKQRLKRLGNRPQFISHESSVDETKSYLKKAHPIGNFTFLAMPSPNHTDAWVLRDNPQRQALRVWYAQQLK